MHAKNKKMIMVMSLVFLVAFPYTSFAQSVWNCWEMTYRYDCTEKNTHTNLETREKIEISNHETSSLFSVKVNENNITFRSSYIHKYYLGLHQFNTSEEYNTYLTEVWDYDAETNTSKVTLIYLPSEKKVCLADNQGNLSYSNFSLPIDILELIRNSLGNGYLLKGWFLPVNAPDFAVKTDYSAYNVEVNNDTSSYKETYSGSMKTNFWFKGRYMTGYKLQLTITKEMAINGTITNETRTDITLLYSEKGILYSYCLLSSFTDNKWGYKTDNKITLILGEPSKGLGGIPIYPIILAAIGISGVIVAIVILRRRKRKSQL
ncbi:MAG: hypothetical protein ACTSUF_07265 [Candidatus Heimdallarchaeaceae archaeon]